MTAFKFRLEKVLKHRRRVVDEHSRDVARADRRVAALSRRIAELDQDIVRHTHSMIPREGHALHARDLIGGTSWQDHLHHMREDLDGRLQTAVKDLARYRSRLTGSWRDLEVLSGLKDRQKDNWRVAQDRRERREMDEIGQIRAFRHRGAKYSL